MSDKKVCERIHIENKYKWDLSKIFANQAAWDNEFATAKEEIAKISNFRGKLGEGSSYLYDLLTLQDSLGQKLDKLFVFAKMTLDEDNRINKSQGLRDKAQSLSMMAGEALSFVEPELLFLDESIIKAYIETDDRLKKYERSLMEIYRYKEHILSAKEEQILALSSEMAEASHSTFSLFNNAEIKFPEITAEDGKKIRITHGNYIKLMENSNREVRKQAFHGLYSTYGKYINTIASMYSGSVKKDIFYAKVRNYPSALEAALFEDNIPLDLYNNLINTVEKNLPIFYKYLDIRKSMLELDELHMYDLHNPLIKQDDEYISYEDGFKIVKEALAPLGKEYGELLDRAYNENWIDVMENEGKTSGAYSWGAFGTNPYILMNYQNNLQSVFTLAHELGHSMHSYFSWSNQHYHESYYKIFVAEVASIVNEGLLTNYLLERVKDKDEKIYLLSQYLDDFRGTVIRQTMFAKFEQLSHNRGEAMEGLTADDLSEEYYKLNKLYFGDIAVDEEIKLEWARIPHFYNAFYVYKYATGFAAAEIISCAISSGDQKAISDYLSFLKSGGSDYPNELLKKASVDLTDQKVLDKLFVNYESKVNQLADLVMSR